MAQIYTYQIHFPGSPEGYQASPARIVFYDTNGAFAGQVNFIDPDMNFESDSQSNGVIQMHVPSAMFQSVLDVLRNEKPVYARFEQGRGFLETAREFVGEGDG